MTKKEWWEPELADGAYIARLRQDYPEKCEDKSDEWLLEYYNEGRKYVVLWDHIGEAYAQFERLADAYFKLKSQVNAVADDQADAWLFHCWKPGHSSVFSTVDKNDGSWWPAEQWRGVTRTPLVTRGESELIYGDAPPTSSILSGD
jgi:hypothetical protein